MKSLKNIQLRWTLVLLTLFLGMTGCQIKDEPFPNDPTLEDIVDNATVGDLNNVVTGMESAMRNRLGTYADGVGVIGREWYRFSGSEPRFTSELLGKGNAILDNNTFYLTNPYYERYRVVRNGTILLQAVENTSADLSEAEKTGYRAFARTISAYQLLLNLNMMGQNGIRIDVENPDDLGPFLDYNTALAGIKTLLDDANAELNSAEFAFVLSSGFAGFDDPAGFQQFNRAIAARVALYQGDYGAAANALSNSFLDPMGTTATGVYHVFSASGGDALNPIFFAPGSTGEQRVAHPSFITDAEAGDARLDKVLIRSDTAFQDGLSSNYDVYVYKTNVDAIPIIRNEELVLIDAEVKAMTSDPGGAVAAIDVVRGWAMLPAYTGGTSTTELMDEILNQRRYSLYGESQRWVDMRRTNRLGQLPIDRPDDDVWENYPIPENENQ